MHIKEGLIIKEINNEYVLLDAGIAPPIFNGMIKVNEVGAFIIKSLQDKDYSLEELYSLIKDKYETNDDELNKSVIPFLEELKKVRLINE